MIEAVVFDFDGTILDTESVWYDSFRIVLSEHGVDLPVSVFAKGIGTFDNSLFAYIEEKLGPDTDLVQLKAKAFEIHQSRASELALREGVIDYLDSAQRLGLRIGLATSSSKSWVEPYLTRYDLLRYFETVCTGDDVEKVKPDPALYALAADRLGVKPAAAVAFEDSANGALAAVRAGLRCVIVPNSLTADLEFGSHDLRISSMADLPLEELLKKVG